MIQMELSRLVIAENSEEQVVILREMNGTRTLPIIIGSYEAVTLNRKLNNVKTPRPLPHDLMENILKGTSCNLTKIIITQLKNNTFYANLVLRQNGKEVEIDARPSDALILATQAKAPIYVNEEVLDKLTEAKEQ